MKTILTNKLVVIQTMALRILVMVSLVLCGQWLAGPACAQGWGNWPFLVSTNGYWNVTDITDPGQPVALGLLQAPFSKTNYMPSPGPNNSPAPPPSNTPWHTDGATLGNHLFKAYGTAPSGGYYGYGTVYSLTDNTHNVSPNQVLVVGNVIYGTTAGSSIFGVGTVFRVNIDGTGFKTLHIFNGADGANPSGALVFSGGVLYGTTSSGGVNGYGEIFSISPDGSIFKHVYDFQGGNDGAGPMGLLLVGNTLYGTASYGANHEDYINGEYGDGTVYSVHTDGTAFTTLHAFDRNLANDSATPVCTLVMSGSVLYGTTDGGPWRLGDVFSIDTVHGNTFHDLYEFTDVNNDGARSEAGLLVINGVLYGTTYYGGSNGLGMVFSYNPASNRFTNIWSFNGTTDGGQCPASGLTLSNGKLYGTTSGDVGLFIGPNNVFSIDISHGNAYQSLDAFNDSTGDYPDAGVVISGGVLYGSTPVNGAAGFGMIFTNNMATGAFGIVQNFRPSPLYTVSAIYSFSGQDRNDGSDPCAQLAISGSTYYGVPVTLYGTTRTGGQHLTNSGTIFSVRSDGSNYRQLHTFAGGAGGAYPVTRLLISGNTLYGTTSNTVYRINADGTGFTTLGSVWGASELVLSFSGATLYGTALPHGTNLFGMVFSINTDGTGFKDLYDFQGGSDGEYPNAGLDLWTNAIYSVPQLLNPPIAVLYGTTRGGGTNGEGTVFSINTDGSNYKILYAFGSQQYDGAEPLAGMILRPQTGGEGYDTLYGTTYAGGTNGLGSLFSVATDGSFCHNIYSFAGPDGIGPECKLTLLESPEIANPDPTLIGTTTAGGAYGKGTVFTLNTTSYGADPIFPFYYNFTGTSEGGSTAAGLTMDIGDHSDSVLSLQTTLNITDSSQIPNIDASIAIDNAAELYVNGIFVTNYYTDADASWLNTVALQPFLHTGTNDIRVVIGGDTGPNANVPPDPLDNNDYFDMIITNSSRSATLTLPPPTGVVAVPGNAQVTLTWNPVIGATGYNVYRSTVSGGPYTLLGTTPTTLQTTYTDTGLVNGVTYYYVIVAVDVGVYSTYSIEVNATPEPVLIGYWPFYEGSGTVLHDVVGGDDGTIYNGTWGSGVSGYNQGPYALSFNGSSTYVEIPSTTGLAFGANPFSISFWFNGELTGNAYPAILTDNPGDWETGCFALRYSNLGYQGLSVHWYPTDYILYSPLTQGTWHHAVFIRNGTSISLYIDTVLKQTTSVSATAPLDLGDGGAMFLGGHAWDGATSYYLGSLEQLRIFAGALSQAEIDQLYGGTPPPSPPTITAQPQSLMAINYWDSATFSVTATGATGYQWEFNGTPIPGATSSTYTIPSVAETDGGDYTVVVSNSGGSVTSAVASLAVQAGYWAFYEGSGSVLDEDLTTDNGAIYNATWDSGLFGPDLDFDGSSSYVAIPDTAALNPGTGAFTISVWFYGGPLADQNNTYPAILSNNPGDWEAGCFALRWQNLGSDDFTVHWNPEGDPILDSGPISEQQWHNAVVIRDGTTMSLYIDNSLVQTATVSADDPVDLGNGGNMFLGGHAWDGDTSYYLGSMQLLRVFRGALTSDEINTLYNNPTMEVP
jgi:uncharacterized repeat protein (TIGR03803 family)